jgi:hypothetical protein
MKKVITLISTVVFVACGVEESEDIVIHVPEATVIEKTVIVEKTVVATPTPSPIQCRVYAVDLHGSITYLSHDDRFYSNILMAKVFSENEAKNLVKLKNGKYNAGKSTVVSYCK